MYRKLWHPRVHTKLACYLHIGKSEELTHSHLGLSSNHLLLKVHLQLLLPGTHQEGVIYQACGTEDKKL